MTAFEAYLKNLTEHERTRTAYLSAAQYFTEKIAKDKSNIIQKDVDAFVRDCEEKHHKKSTLKLRLYALKAHALFLENRELALYIGKQIAELKHKKEKKTRVKCKLHLEDINTLRAFQTRANRLRNRSLTDLLVCTGARISELLALRFCDFRLDAHGNIVVDIYQSKADTTREDVVLSESAEQSLREYAKDKLFVSKDRLFDFTRFAADQIIKRDLEKAGLPKQSCHKLRHFYGTAYASKVKNPFQLQKLLGHSSFSSTKVYIDDVDISDLYAQRREFCSERVNNKAQQAVAV